MRRHDFLWIVAALIAWGLFSSFLPAQVVDYSYTPEAVGSSPATRRMVLSHDRTIPTRSAAPPVSIGCDGCACDRPSSKCGCEDCNCAPTNWRSDARTTTALQPTRAVRPQHTGVLQCGPEGCRQVRAATVVAPANVAPANVRPASASYSRGSSIAEVNAIRARRGLQPFIEDPALTAVAYRKASMQARRGRMFHPGGSMGGARYEGVGVGSRFSACYLFSQGSRYAGAATVVGRNGRRYHCLLIR